MTRGMAMLLTLLVLASALFAGWYSTRRVDYFPEGLKSLSSDCDYMGRRERQPVLSDFDDEWFSDELASFHEPSLYRRPPGTPRAVRFTWLRSFHDLIAVRVETLADGRLELTAKQRPGGAGFQLTDGLPRSREQVRILSPDEARRFEAGIAAAGLLRASDSGCFTGTDGAQWIVEARDPQTGYRYRNFQSPDVGIERDVGLMMIGLTGWEVGPIY